MNLFKLTKDGKCVGYMRWGKSPSRGNDELTIQIQYQSDDIWYENAVPPLNDAMHPFVCTDKNGDKVFLNDHVLHTSYYSGYGTVDYVDNDMLMGCMVDFDDPDRVSEENDCSRKAARITAPKDIELLKDNEVKNELNPTTNPSPADTGS